MKCKYFNPQMVLIAKMVGVLYDDFECHTGGLCHIVTDEDNIKDIHLQSIIEECNKDENKEDISVDAAKYICESMIKLPMIQREFIFAALNEGLDIEDLSHNDGECLDCEDICDGKCSFKHQLNRFHAERLCAERYGSNEKFLTGEFPAPNLD